MKELSIEDKAKRYDEAIERAKLWRNASNVDKIPTFANRVINEIFPELAESDNESIRKSITEFFKNYSENGTWKAIPDVTKWVAWLEKQGEQKPNPCENCSIATNNCQKFPCAIRDGEQKPTDNEMIEILRTEYEKGSADAIEEMQNHTWSEEDERNFDWLITVCERIHYKSDPQVSPKGALILRDWLKSLKDRVLSQPKQEWSEEDENRINRLIAYFEDKESFTAEDDIVYANWLKSLRPQNKWKPSDEQMRALKQAKTDACGKPYFNALASLYVKLKGY